MPGRSIALPLLAALISIAAAPPPYPAASDPASLKTWLTAQTKIKPEQVAVAGPDSIFAVEPASGAASNPDARRIRLRQEVVRPTFAVVLGGRSAVLDMEVDCMGRSVLRRSFDVYTAPNLTGAVDHLGSDKRWTPADPGTSLALVVDAACDPMAPRPFDALAATELAAAPPVKALAPAPEPAAEPPAPSPAVASPNLGLRGSVSAAPNLVAELGEFGTVEEAEAAWREAAALVPAIAGRSPRLELAGTAAVTRYRALVDGFDDRAEAVALCRTLAAKGHACHVRG